MDGYSAAFNRQLQSLCITQIDIPFRSPQADAIAGHWVTSVRTESLDKVLVVNIHHLGWVLAAYVAYFNRWRARSSLAQRVPCTVATSLPHCGVSNIVAEPVHAGLHHVYMLAA